jgi:hypothetical protein
MLWVQIPLRGGVLDTTLCDKDCQCLATGWWFSQGTPGVIRNCKSEDRLTCKGTELKDLDLKLFPANLRAFSPVPKVMSFLLKSNAGNNLRSRSLSSVPLQVSLSSDLQFLITPLWHHQTFFQYKTFIFFGFLIFWRGPSWLYGSWI